MAKRSQVDSWSFDTEADKTRKRDFYEKYKTPYSAEYEGEIRKTLTDEVIENRLQVIERGCGQNAPEEDVVFKNDSMYNSARFGWPLIKILMCYLLSMKVKVPEIDLKVYYPKPICKFLFATRDKNEIFSEDLNKLSKKVFRFFVTNFLWHTQLHLYVSKYMSSSKKQRQASHSDATDDEVTVEEETLVVRRCMQLSVGIFSGNITEAHALFLFWQLRRTEHGFALEYGVCDNLSLEDYEVSEGCNFDFHQEIRTAFRDFLTENATYSDSFTFHFIELYMYTTKITQMLHSDLSYECISASNRALLYCAVLYDIFQMHQNHLIESLQVSESKHASYIMRRNVVAYQHYMNKMINWMLESKLIWPEYDPNLPVQSQTMPTPERPTCQVYFVGDFHEINLDKFDKYQHTPLQQQPTFMNEMNETQAYFTLYNVVTKEITFYYFQWDGDQVFSPSRYHDYVKHDTCSISAHCDSHVISKHCDTSAISKHCDSHGISKHCDTRAISKHSVKHDTCAFSAHCDRHDTIAALHDTIAALHARLSNLESIQAQKTSNRMHAVAY